MLDVPFYWLDVFTSEPFKGNPAAVCIMKTDLDDSIYQNIATELGLAETAFTEKIHENEYKLRWFAPVFKEVSLCGHATIATAYILNKNHNVQSLIRFHTRSGVLMAEVQGDKVTLNFPSYIYDKFEDERILEPFGIEEYLEIRYLPDQPTPAVCIVLKDQGQVEKIKPDFPRLVEVSNELDIFGIIITAVGEDPYDYVYRQFAPRAGVDEDQGTGIVHCVIAPYWGDKLGKTKMRAFQLSERGSMMDVEVVENGVKIIGSATSLVKGTLMLNI
jgi:PhzF family phenazine biosynthesis protein